MLFMFWGAPAQAANRTVEILSAMGGIFVISAILATHLVKKKQIKEKPVKILTFAVYFWVAVFFQAVGYALISALI